MYCFIYTYIYMCMNIYIYIYIYIYISENAVIYSDSFIHAYQLHTLRLPQSCVHIDYIS